jgi:hypothetical protein
MLADEGGVAGDQRFVWESLVPRLVSPLKLAAIEALLHLQRPLSAADLQQLFPGDLSLRLELVRYQLEYLARAGVLELVGTAPQPGGAGDEPTYSLTRRR